MSARPTYRVEIPYSSYDSSQRGYFYGIQVTRALPSSKDGKMEKPVTSQVKRRRFRDFLALYQEYANDADVDSEDLGAFPCSKYYDTHAKARKPHLQAFLNRLVALDQKINRGGVLSKRLQRFLGLDQPTSFPPRALTFEEYELTTLEEQKRNFAWEFAFVLAGLAVASQLLPLEQLLASAGVAVLLWIYWRARAKAKRRAAYLQSERVKQASLSVDLSLVSKERDVTVTNVEMDQLPVLRARLVDFCNGTTPEYDEWFLKTHGAVIQAFGEAFTLPLDGSVLTMAQRKLAWERNVFKDYRLALFSRFNKHNLDTAESQARFALTTRVAFKLDSILTAESLATVFRPQQRWLDYLGSPVLTRSLQDPVAQRAERLDKFWLRDREGGLCTFARMGAAPSNDVYHRLFAGSDVDMVKTMLFMVEVFRGDMDEFHEASGPDRKVPASVTVVADMAGFTLADQIPSSEVLALVKKYVPLFSPGYAGLLKRLIVINAPWYVNMLLNIVRPFIPKDILDSVIIHAGCDLDKMVRPFVEDKYIPKYLGGQLVGANGDVYCSDRITPVGPFLPGKGEHLFQQS